MQQPTINRPLSNCCAAIALSFSACLASVVTAACLVLEFGGFAITSDQLASLHMAEVAGAGLLVAERFARLGLAGGAGCYFRAKCLDFCLIVLAGLATVIAILIRPAFLSAGSVVLIVVQIFLVLAILLRVMGLYLKLMESRINPAWLLFGTFVVLCAAGSGLLMLPRASHEVLERPMYYMDALFTSFSAVCMTSLPLRNIGADFTPLGQTVILGLIQLGALGVLFYGMVLALQVGRGLTGCSQSADSEISTSARKSPISLGRVAIFVVATTFIIELIGTAMLYPMFLASPGMQDNPAEALWYSVFHSVSAFCNAGFSLYPKNFMQGVSEGWTVQLRERWQMLGVIAPLIILGGLGFTVLEDCARYIGGLLRRLATVITGGTRRAASGLSLQTKLVLTATAMLIVFGALGLVLIEPATEAGARKRGAFGAENQGFAQKDQSDWYSLGNNGRVRQAVFQSISARTGGFHTIDCGSLSNGGKLWLSGLMVVGAGPGGTGGGIKVVVFAIILLTFYSALLRRRDVEVFDRLLPADLLRKTMAVAVSYLGLVAVVALMICLFVDPQENFVDILFESCSACGSVGLSTGLTAKLDDPGKIVMMAGMFLGRIGPMMLMLALTAGGYRGRGNSYPVENILVA